MPNISCMVSVTIYSRPGRCLCDKVKALIQKVKKDIPFHLSEVDISSDPELCRKYGELIPVVAIDGEDRFVSKVSELWFRRAIQESLKGRRA